MRASFDELGSWKMRAMWPCGRDHATTRGFSSARDDAISEAKKIGSARKPASASGALVGGVSRFTGGLPR